MGSGITTMKRLPDEDPARKALAETAALTSTAPDQKFTVLGNGPTPPLPGNGYNGYAKYHSTANPKDTNAQPSKVASKLQVIQGKAEVLIGEITRNPAFVQKGMARIQQGQSEIEPGGTEEANATAK